MSRVFQPWSWWEKEKNALRGVISWEVAPRSSKTSSKWPSQPKMNTSLSSTLPKTLATLFHSMVCQAQDWCFGRCVKPLNQDLYLTQITHATQVWYSFSMRQMTWPSYHTYMAIWRYWGRSKDGDRAFHYQRGLPKGPDVISPVETHQDSDWKWIDFKSYKILDPSEA